ncbi:hypothetical protein AMIS_66980 [Actinoplanes missouriensis 431]|uniref:Uncharacterized protein n=1 Tax=Actinoplanes missouriensis (strain ATCC 14538 / DSM 43046 / CBS 188.64 / JCM 3121 / NBRC 102363 / NCIMB 12654 / NRRL B-3342 / UNCC 431) TaxID=512565 RepID=I0HFY1_ACTM4|nr:hypothetical protein [Actinoplanes missouriensis]BAL91918.1 hypothetical protein AMIS_66980 [Actinoplanes missouriensis 431]
MQKRDYAFVLLGVEALALVGVIYYLVTLDFMSLAWAASIAVALPAWVLAVKAPTTCGVTTQKGGRCSRKVNGVIFGCSQSEHVWAKFFARFGWHRQADPNTPGARAGRLPTGGEGVEVVTVKIAEDGKSTAAFWLALTATLCALTSATVDVTNFLRDRQEPKPPAATATR